jgi:hypothetical protein
MYSTVSTSIHRRCLNCNTIARDGAAYCPRCGTPLSSTAPVTASTAAKPKTSKSKFPWITILIACGFFGVFQTHRGHSVSSSPAPFHFGGAGSAVQPLPPDALQAIQPSDDARWNGDGDVGLEIYNGSQWTISYLDVEVQIKQGYRTVQQTYRATINTTPLAPLSSEYVTVHTALPRMHEGLMATYRVVGAMGTKGG